MGILMVFGGVVKTQVFIPATEAVGPQPTVPGTGLNGAWYFDPGNPTRGIGSIATAQNLIASERAYAQFSASYLLYIGGDTAPANVFLTSFFQNDGNTLNPPNNDQMQSSIFDFTGYISIGSADLDTTFGLSSDDGSRMLIGQSAIQVVDNDFGHGNQLRTGEAIFEAPGLYPIEIIYFNSDFTNNGLPHQGGANLYFLSTLGGGGPVSPPVLNRSVPYGMDSIETGFRRRGSRKGLCLDQRLGWPRQSVKAVCTYPVRSHGRRFRQGCNSSYGGAERPDHGTCRPSAFLRCLAQHVRNDGVEDQLAGMIKDKWHDCQRILFFEIQVEQVQGHGQSLLAAGESDRNLARAIDVPQPTAPKADCQCGQVSRSTENRGGGNRPKRQRLGPFTQPVAYVNCGL